jgi:hypothetical protein
MQKPYDAKLGSIGMRKSSRTSTKLLRPHILSGINELVKPWRDDLRNDFENIPLKESKR